jgi:hypothetical protein
LTSFFAERFGLFEARSKALPDLSLVRAVFSAASSFLVVFADAFFPCPALAFGATAFLVARTGLLVAPSFFAAFDGAFFTRFALGFGAGLFVFGFERAAFEIAVVRFPAVADAFLACFALGFAPALAVRAAGVRRVLALDAFGRRFTFLFRDTSRT